MNDRISNRHMRTAHGLAQAEDATPVAVAIEIDSEWAASPAGQLIATCLGNLLCRQTDLVREIIIESDDYPLVVPVAGAEHATTLHEALEQLSTWAVGGAVRMTFGNGSADANLAIGRARDAAQLVGIGRGWDAWAGRATLAPEVFPGESHNPIGPFLAASLMAGEVFKLARGVTRGQPLQRFSYSLWTDDAADWTEQSGPEITGADLPPFYVIGAGAVGQALIYIIGAARFRRGYLVVIDDDIHDETNLNRCFLAGLEDRPHPKIDAVVRFLSSTPIDTYCRQMTLRSYVVSPKPRLLPALAEAEAKLHFGTIASCVDKGSSRQDIRGLHPSLIVGGSTSGMTAKTNVYDGRRGSACLSCHNPAEDDAERLRELERHLRTMCSAEKRAFLHGKVPDVEAVITHLDKPGCGSAGEQMLRAHATEQPREFSVSFVSMAAGVLQAAALFRELLFGQSAKQTLTNLSFLNGQIGGTDIGPDESCKFCYSEDEEIASVVDRV